MIKIANFADSNNNPVVYIPPKRGKAKILLKTSYM